VAISIDTLAKVHEYNGRISVYCMRCDRHAWLDLPSLIASGHGAREVVGLRLRCKTCGAPGHLSIVWDGRR